MPSLKISSDGAVGVLTLARPEVFNSLSLDLIAELRSALAAFEEESGVRAVLIRAEGKHFCTGAALDEVLQRHTDAAAMTSFMEEGHALCRALEASPLPIIAAVHGLCLAGGLELMLACDVVIAARSARFGDQHAKFGLLPGWGSTQRLPRMVGLRRALDLMLSARWIEAREAEAWGLVTRTVDDADLDRESVAYGATLATRSAPGLALMKRLAREGLEDTLEEGLRREVAAAAPAFASADIVEGLAAFREKREPRFS